MSDSPQPGSTTLIARLSDCPTDAEAWSLFVQRYSGTIYGWCCRYGLQDADAQDVTQDVFAGLMRQLRNFDRSRGCFRNWLYRIVQNRVSNWCSNPEHRHERGTEAVRRRLDSEEARRDLEARLNEEFDLERLEVAEMNVQLLVNSHSWQAYQLRCKERLSLRETSKRIGIPVGHVSKYALRVRGMIARQIILLEERLASADDREMECRHEELPAAGELAEIRAGSLEPRGRSRPHRTCSE